MWMVGEVHNRTLPVTMSWIIYDKKAKLEILKQDELKWQAQEIHSTGQVPTLRLIYTFIMEACVSHPSLLLWYTRMPHLFSRGLSIKNCGVWLIKVFTDRRRTGWSERRGWWERCKTPRWRRHNKVDLNQTGMHQSDTFGSKIQRFYSRIQGKLGRK